MYKQRVRVEHKHYWLYYYLVLERTQFKVWRVQVQLCSDMGAEMEVQKV